MNRETADSPPSAERVVQAVCDLMAEGGRPLPHHGIERVVSEQLGISMRSVRGAIRFLVQEGRFSYSHRNGTAYLETSFWKPVRISDRIWLCPARSSSPQNPPPHRILIRMNPGAAFGIGDHPTTRLALRAIEHVLAEGDLEEVLDIGTGTGVLAIAAGLLGARRILALDIDACARAEAAANAAENGLSGRIEIRNLSLDQIRGRFSLVCANLRPPTLSLVAARSARFSKEEALAVLSGFRPEEWPPLEQDCRNGGWEPFWQTTGNGWMAVACRKDGANGPPADR